MNDCISVEKKRLNPAKIIARSVSFPSPHWVREIDPIRGNRSAGSIAVKRIMRSVAVAKFR